LGTKSSHAVAFATANTDKHRRDGYLEQNGQALAVALEVVRRDHDGEGPCDVVHNVRIPPVTAATAIEGERQLAQTQLRFPIVTRVQWCSSAAQTEIILVTAR
jgi:hypothetical protein